VLLGFCFVFVAGLALSGCRQDMHNQPKFIPLRSSEFFPDRRSARYPVAGTVPRLDDPRVDAEQLDPNSYFLTGRHNGTLGNELPFGTQTPQQMHELLTRGQERYNIYCSPCHARLGDGNGMIVQRGYKRPPSFHQDRLRNAPLGHFFDVMSYGFGAMPDYAAQIHPADRWAIAAYIRALQVSQDPGMALNQAQIDEELKKMEPNKNYQIKLPLTSKDDKEVSPGSNVGGTKP
jgi:mono/diheme cytochrome c family protein